MNVDVTPDGMGWVHSAHSYIAKCLDNVEKILGKRVGKESTPNKSVWHPELDESPLLDEVHRNKYQQLVGIGIWIVTIGRIDITYTVMTLSRFNHKPTEGHLKDITRVFAYVKKYPRHCLMISNNKLG